MTLNVSDGDGFSLAVRQGLVDVCAKLARSVGTVDRPIVAAAMVRNESDIIERFVRHTLDWADALIVVDHASTDGTRAILDALVAEGLPLGVVEDRAFGFHQAARMTDAMHLARTRLGAAVVVPLDADELLIDTRGGNPASSLRKVAAEEVKCVRWRTYIPTPQDNADEFDVAGRITRHLATEPVAIGEKVVIGGAIAGDAEARISHGNHRLFIGSRPLEADDEIEHLRLAHFPVRNAGQFASKVAAKLLSLPFAPDRSPKSGWYYRQVAATYENWWQLSPEELQNVAERYFANDSPEVVGLVRAPVPNGAPLRYRESIGCDPFANVFAISARMMERLADAPDGLVEYTGLREPITAENRALRKALEGLAAQRGYDARGWSVEEIETVLLDQRQRAKDG